MNNIIYKALAAAAFLASLVSCKRMDVDVRENATGYLYVSLERDDSEELVFKSVSDTDAAFVLKIYNELDQLVATVEDHRTLGETPLALNVGKYTVTATSADAPAAAQFDAPFYSGTAGFEVLPDQVTNIDITCSLANVKVTAVFSDEIKKNFKTYALTVSNGSAALVFSNQDGSEDKTAYFSPTGTLTWTLHLENNDGQEYTLSDTYQDVKPKQHYRLSFELEEKEEFGAGGFYIVLDDTMTEKKYDLVLDFGDEDVPESSSDFEIPENGVLELNAGDNTSKVLTFTSQDGFRNLILSYGPTVSAMSAVRTSTAQVDLVGATSEEIAALEAAGIRTAAVEEGATEAKVDITDYIAAYPIGSTTVSVLAVDVNGAFKETSVDFVLRSPVEVEAVSADPWAMFATVKGKWFAEAQPSGIAFQYRKASESTWTDIAAVTPDAGTRTYTAMITGLKPQTEYVFRAVSDKDKETKEITFTTETAEVLHNMSFDNWYQEGKAWYPNASSSDFIWDSANGGTANLPLGLGIVPTTPTSEVAVSGDGKQAAQLKSAATAGKFAAGNLFTGKFGKATLNPVGAELDWGVPFTSRPLALKGYFKYDPKTIDYASGDYSHLKGTQDMCQIQILLSDWTAPFHVNTGANQFVQFDSDPNIIAYGSFEYGEMTDGYQPFEIRLDYRDETKIPTYIVIVAAASRYGDYYTGGVGSTLLLDEFEFVYDPDELSE